MVGELLIEILLNKILQSISTKMHYYYLLRYCMKQTQLLGLFFKKDVTELVVKILEKYTYKEILKIPS